MARQRGFDEQDAVAAAARLFTARGYEGTSVDDLVVGLGIHRGSLYRTFGSKLELFHRVLRTYVDGELLPWVEKLNAAKNGPLTAGVTKGPDLGLLLVAAVERAPTDPVAAAEVARVFEALAGAFGGDHEVATGLAGALVGLRLQARAGASTTTITRAARALSARVGI